MIVKTEELHGFSQPSDWVVAWSGLISPAGQVLDLAAGAGRHANWLAGRGHLVTAIDRDAQALAQLAPSVNAIAADLEDGSPSPLCDRSFDAIVVTNYLHRPLFAQLRRALAPGGLLIYETFSAGNENFGRPSNPSFLLRPGELLEFCRQAEWIALGYECVTVNRPKPAAIQRIAAARPH